MKPRRKTIWVVVAVVMLLVALGGPYCLKWAVASQKCLKILRSTEYEGRVWADYHESFSMPTNFLCFSNELISPSTMICPADHNRVAAQDWAQFDSAHNSYELVGPGVRITQTNSVFLRCKVHGYVCYVGGATARR